MKKIHLHEVKLIDDTIHRGEIAYKDDIAIILRLKNNQLIYLPCTNIVLIKDLGWQKQ